MLDPIASSDEALVRSIRVMAAWQGEHSIVESGGALFVRGKTRFPTLYANCVIGRDRDPEPEAIFAAASTAFADRHFIVWTRDHADERLRADVTKRGLTSFGRVPAMILEHPIGPPPSVAGLETKAVSTPEDLADYVRVCGEAYAHTGMPPDIVAKVFARLDVSGAPNTTLVVVRAAGESLAAALSVTVGDLGGVFWVGTRPSGRRRGAATLAAHHVTHASFEAGARVVTLQASAEGEPIYRKMGYRVVTNYDRLLSPKPSVTDSPGRD